MKCKFTAIAFLFSFFYFSAHGQIKPIDFEKDEYKIKEKTEFLMYRDVRKNKIDMLSQFNSYEQFKTSAAQNRTSTSINLYWSERGPFDIGGRSNGISYIPSSNYPYRAYTATSTGIYSSLDYRSGNWRRIGNSDRIANGAWTNIVPDPNNANALYACSGFGLDGGTYRKGDGVYKSTNNGSAWSQLTGTSNVFEGPNKLVLGKNNKLFVSATGYGIASKGGVFRIDMDNANSTSKASPTDYGVNVEAGNNGDIWITNFSSCGNGKLLVSRYWKNGSLTGTSGTWDDVTPTLTNTDFGTRNPSSMCLHWTFVGITKADTNRIYLSAAATIPGVFSGILHVLFRSENNGLNWKYLNTIPSQSGAFYHVPISIDQLNPDILYYGEVNQYRSINKGDTYSSISSGTTQFNPPFQTAKNMTGHVDPRVSLSNLNSSGQGLFGNDGGLYYSSNLFSTTTNPTFRQVSGGYNTSMYYSIDLHPSSGNYNWVGGTQDNGEHFTNGNNTSIYLNGDGFRSYYDEDNPETTIWGTNSNSYYRKNVNSPTASQIYVSGNLGEGDLNNYYWNNPTDWDSDANLLYISAYVGKYARLNFDNSPNTTYINFPSSYSGYRVSCVKVDPLEANTVWFALIHATQNLQTKILKVTNANTSSPTFTDRSPSNFPNAAWIGSIAFPRKNNNDDIIVSFSNTGISNIWYSGNEGISWSTHDGNLPDININDAEIIQTSLSSTGYVVLLATSIGLWYTDQLNQGITQWIVDNQLPYQDVRDISFRYNDKIVGIGTFYNGLWMTKFFTNSPVEVDFDVSNSSPSVSETIAFYDKSFGDTSWLWNFGDGTTSALQNPAPKSYSSLGTKTITLTINGSVSISKTITVVAVSAITRSDDNKNESNQVKNKSNTAKISISPNPAKDRVMICSNEELRNVTIKVVSINGEVVYYDHFDEFIARDIELQPNLSKGYYQIFVESEGELISSDKLLVN